MHGHASRNSPSTRIPGTLVLYLVLFSLAGALTAIASQARSDDTQSWLLSWIPSRCCVTNECCFRVASTEVQALQGDLWLIVASGQMIQRTDWSPDGNYWRCACDQIKGKWTVHPAAYTRCLYIPMPNS